MRPELTSCGAPTMLSPQKPEAPPMRTTREACLMSFIAVLRKWGSADLALPIFPVRLAQLTLEQLAARVARQRLDEVHRLRAFVVREALAQPRDDPGRIRRHAGTQDHAGLHGLAPALVGHADHGAFADRRVRGEHVLDLRGVDVLAARDDHVLQPVVDVQEAVAAVAGVARAHPTPALV